MAVKSADQLTIIDVTDAYSVILTNDSYTFLGSTNAAKPGSTTTQIVALRGAQQVAASVTVSEMTIPNGITVSKDSDPTSPTLTITATTALTQGGVVSIPVHIGDVTITKEFSFAIAFTGATGAPGESGTRGGVWYTGTAITGESTTATVFPSSGIASAVPGDMYLNTNTQDVYKCTVGGAASVAKWVHTGNIKGAAGEPGSTGAAGATWYSGTKITGTNTTGTVFANSGISSAKVGDMYLNTSTQNVYKCTVGGAASVAKWAYSCNIKGETGSPGAAGAPGADAITLVVTSSNGIIFKNSAIETTLTAHVYKGGVEVTDIASLGTIKWYKDGGATAIATGATLTIDAGDVTGRATYTAQLEG